MHRLAVVIPTIGRYDELRRMLRSLAARCKGKVNHAV
jgi:hypothetical protein